MGFLEASQGTPETDHGEIFGNQYEIACSAWFRSDGSPQPLSFKFKGDDDSIQTVRDIHVNHMAAKNYSGIPTKEFHCDAVIGGLHHEFKLIFYCESCRWVMLIGER